MTMCFFTLAKTETLCGRTQDILLLKGTKHQLSPYDKRPRVLRFIHACLTFQFRWCPVTEGLQRRLYIGYIISPHKYM